MVIVRSWVRNILAPVSLEYTVVNCKDLPSSTREFLVHVRRLLFGTLLTITGKGEIHSVKLSGRLI